MAQREKELNSNLRDYIKMQSCIREATKKKLLFFSGPATKIQNTYIQNQTCIQHTEDRTAFNTQNCIQYLHNCIQCKYR